jgi:hypothetical protein
LCVTGTGGDRRPRVPAHARQTNSGFRLGQGFSHRDYIHSLRFWDFGRWHYCYDSGVDGGLFAHAGNRFIGPGLRSMEGVLLFLLLAISGMAAAPLPRGLMPCTLLVLRCWILLRHFADLSTWMAPELLSSSLRFGWIRILCIGYLFVT